MSDDLGSAEQEKQGVAPWRSPQLPTHDVDAEWPEAVVVLSLHPERGKDAEIVVRPSRAYLRRGRRLLFLVNAAPEDEVVIKFKADGECPDDPPRTDDRPRIIDTAANASGPFPDGPVVNGQRPSYSGRYEQRGPGEVQTELARRRGFFSFDVWWRRGGKEYGKDPAVIVFDHAGISL